MRQHSESETMTIAQYGGPLDDEHSMPLDPHERDGVLVGVEAILSHYRSDAFVLEAYDHVAEARLIHEICNDITHALTDFLAFVDEEEAMRLTRRSRASLRKHFSLWEKQGHAWTEEGMGHHYRAIVLGLIVTTPSLGHTVMVTKT